MKTTPEERKAISGRTSSYCHLCHGKAPVFNLWLGCVSKKNTRARGCPTDKLFQRLRYLLLSNSIQRIVLKSVLILVGAGILSAQSLPLRGVITNKDVVMLANAGFDEEFVIEVIESSHRRFDTTADGVAGLFNQGISQAVIELMIAISAPDRVVTGVPVPATYPPSPNSPQRTGGVIARSAQDAAAHTMQNLPTVAAVAGNVPYYEWKSVFFGLWSKKVGVGGVSRPDEMIGVQTALYPRWLHPRPRYHLPVRTFPTLPAPGVVPVSAHYTFAR